MSKPHPVQDHFRKTFLAGAFAAVPVAVTIFLIYVIDQRAGAFVDRFVGRHIPFLGVVLAIVLIYLAGLITTSLLGKYCLGIVDKLLTRVPGFKSLYSAWKHIALTPGGSEGTFAKVVLIPDETGVTHLLGFCSGEPIEGDPNTFCVFVPAAPNPMNGRMYFVRREKCQFVEVTPEEAFKVILSTGNYVPPGVGAATALLTKIPAPASNTG